jgi:hypothetical protein
MAARPVVAPVVVGDGRGRPPLARRGAELTHPLLDAVHQKAFQRPPAATPRRRPLRSPRRRRRSSRCRRRCRGPGARRSASSGPHSGLPTTSRPSGDMLREEHFTQILRPGVTRPRSANPNSRRQPPSVDTSSAWRLGTSTASSGSCMPPAQYRRAPDPMRGASAMTNAGAACSTARHARCLERASLGLRTDRHGPPLFCVSSAPRPPRHGHLASTRTA